MNHDDHERYLTGSPMIIAGYYRSVFLKAWLDEAGVRRICKNSWLVISTS